MRLSQTWVPIGEAAAYLGVTKPRVYALITEKRLDSLWDYGRRMVGAASLRRYHKERRAFVKSESERIAAAPCSQS